MPQQASQELLSALCPSPELFCYCCPSNILPARLTQNDCRELPRYAAILHIVFASLKCSGQQIMPRSTSSLCAGILAAVLGSGAALSASAAPSLSEADDRAIKEAI